MNRRIAFCTWLEFMRLISFCNCEVIAIPFCVAVVTRVASVKTEVEPPNCDLGEELEILLMQSQHSAELGRG